MNVKVRRTVSSALVAAIYVALTMALAPVSFGPIQIRVAEAMCMLAVFGPCGAYGVTVGCLVSNALGAAIGVNTPVDILFGTVATALAASLSYACRNVRIKNLPILSAIPPILFNAIIIGVELSIVYSSTLTPASFSFYALPIALSETVTVMLLGLPLYAVMARTGLCEKLM